MISSINKPTCLILPAIILLLSGLPLFSQELRKDQVIDTVRCQGQKDQSYSLFVPPGYSASQAWPVIMIFDPSARGKLATGLFAEAGRKYGFIIACSNNSRNGPYSDNLNAAVAMTRDISQRYRIDQKRIFVAGFSGGSRFAMAFASSEKGIAGVIGCGAGLPNDNKMLPSPYASFLYYGFAGTRDMNFIEMHDLPAWLTGQTRVTSFVRFFDGGHQWPETSLLTDAVGWMVMKEMEMKVIPADQNIISNVATTLRNLISAEKKSGNYSDAVSYLRYAARDFNWTNYSKEFSGMLSDAEKSQAYPQSVKEWNKTASSEQEKRDSYVGRLSSSLASGSLPDSSMNWWRNEISGLVRSRDRGNIVNSRVAYRLLNFISILCSEQGTGLYRNGDYKLASSMFTICTLSDGENPSNYFNLSRTEAAMGHVRQSADALNSAITKGFSSKSSILSDPAFEKVKNDGRFVTLISRLK